ncbi:MAG: 2,3,4,5-tetrahydropyridine-2,6-dicarboxylate N-succinyltransferase, partial [Burkholderiales bacterium]|nr:2,3,4,5-tetrahydropyridine-2,6-dicarboxylate N-succinyltransferase [Burkholderiales bacterium]
MADLNTVIEQAFENRASISPKTARADVREAVAETIAQLDSGTIRVAEKFGSEWVTNQWVKKAVLLSFRLHDNAVVRDGYTNYFDKVGSKFATYGDADFQAGGFRVVPPAAVRRGAFIAKN